MLARALTSETIRTRLGHIRTVARALGGSPEAVSESHLLTWVVRQSWKLETRRGYYNSIRQFFGWFSHKTGGANPAEFLPRIPSPLALPRPIPDEVLAKALTEGDEIDHLILELAAFAGLRAMEVASTNVRNLRFEGDICTLVIDGKGRKQRAVPVPLELAKRLVDKADTNTGWVFPAQFGDGHVTAHWISRRAGLILPEPWTLHTLRHRFGTKAYLGDRDLLAVQRLLGHSSVATTQRYVEPPSDAVRRAAAAAQKLSFS